MPFMCVACLPHTLFPCPLFALFTARSSSSPTQTFTHTHFLLRLPRVSSLECQNRKQRGKKKKDLKKKTPKTKNNKNNNYHSKRFSLSCSCVSDIHPGSTHEASMLRPHNMMSLMTPSTEQHLAPSTTTTFSSSPPPTELNPTRINPSAGWLPTYCPAYQPTLKKAPTYLLLMPAAFLILSSLQPVGLH